MVANIRNILYNRFDSEQTISLGIMIKKQKPTFIDASIQVGTSQRNKDIFSQIAWRTQRKRLVSPKNQIPSTSPTSNQSTRYTQNKSQTRKVNYPIKGEVLQSKAQPRYSVSKSYAASWQRATTKKQNQTVNYIFKVFSFTVLCLLGVGLGLGINHYQSYWLNSVTQKADTQVLGVDDNTRDAEYEKWIKSNTSGVYSPKELDLDNDDLSNYEEYILGTDPLSIHTCSAQVTDMENILSLINPLSCEPMNLENEEEFEKFDKIINVADLQHKLMSSIAAEPLPEDSLDQNSLLSVFEVDNLNQIADVSIVNLEQESNRKTLKTKYLKLIDRIDAYIAKHRSFETYDRNYDVPVSGVKYLDVSLKYNIPVKYLLAIARAESRFGTDRYTLSGNLTRPGEHKNIFSMGLTDSGSNITFQTWDKGVESMGKWWQRFDQRNVSIARRLKIFNPNGDYPGKIQNMANQIEIFLNSA